MKYRTIETQIPWKYKWKAIDENGQIMAFSKKPTLGNYYDWWIIGDGDEIHIGKGPKPKDWTKTLVKL